MKSAGALSALAILLAGSVALCAKSAFFISGLFFVPFALGPLLVSLTLAVKFSGRKKSQVVLLIGNILYAAWFTFVYLGVFYYWQPDPQGPLALLFIGFYSLPLMAIVWLITYRLGRTRPTTTEP